MTKKVAVIGSGIGGLAVACILQKAGCRVTVYEKNSQFGGRLSILKTKGFTFDKGPSWYLMDDVFDHFFSLFGTTSRKQLDLMRLTPSYRIFSSEAKGGYVDLYGNAEKDSKTFESYEVGADKKLKQYLDASASMYSIAMNDFVYKNYSSLFDFFTLRTLTQGVKLRVFENMQSYVSSYFKDPFLQKIMLYTLVFLGSSPYNAPALYNIMSHVDFTGGVYYPMGGITSITQSLLTIGRSLGVRYLKNHQVIRIECHKNHGKALAKKLFFNKNASTDFDIVVSNADIHHTESKLLEKPFQSYSESYWHRRTIAPSALILYLGVKGKIPTLKHHTLYFTRDWKKTFDDIFTHPRLPNKPSWYICAPSKTDPSVAPKGHENLFVLVPTASGLAYSKKEEELFTSRTINHIASTLKVHDLRKRIVVKESMFVREFESQYNSYRGSALGLAHTLFQTGPFRPDTKSKKVDNLYYVGGNTNPGIGMPMCLISAQLVFKRLIGDTSSQKPQAIRKIP